MTSHGYPNWYVEALKTTILWEESPHSCVLTKTDGSTFEFKKDTTFAMTTRGTKSYFKVTGFMAAREEQGPSNARAGEGGPAGLYFVEWNGMKWVEQDSVLEYLSMTCLPGGIGRRGFIVDWNTVEPWAL